MRQGTTTIGSAWLRVLEVLRDLLQIGQGVVVAQPRLQRDKARAVLPSLALGLERRQVCAEGIDIKVMSAAA